MLRALTNTLLYRHYVPAVRGAPLPQPRVQPIPHISAAGVGGRAADAHCDQATGGLTAQTSAAGRLLRSHLAKHPTLHPQP